MKTIERLCAAWLGLTAVETVIAVAAKWPAQLGGKGDPSKIASQWVTKGTALSPPLFLMVAMAIALVLLSVAGRLAWTRVGAGLAAVVGAIGTVGAAGELFAAHSADVPTGARDAAILGVVVSAAVVGSAIASVWRPRAARSASQEA